MTPKKSISLILSIAILSTTLPVVSFAESEETTQATYAPNRAVATDFDPEATQEPFSNVPVPHTEVVPDTLQMEDAPEIEQNETIDASNVIENILPDMADSNAVLSTTSASDSDLWNALLGNRFGDAYLSPYKKSDGHTVSGQTNRLTIRETDLTLPGKNGLDVTIRRYHDNQFYNKEYVGISAGSYQTPSVLLHIYRFIDTRNNAYKYIGFYTTDEFYLNDMANGITISEYPSDNADRFEYWVDEVNVGCYYYDRIKKKESSSGTITLQYDSTFTPKSKYVSFAASTPYILMEYYILPNRNRIGYDWTFEMPEACLFGYETDTTNYDDYKVKITDYVGAFRDIDGTVHQLQGSGRLVNPDEGDSTYTSILRSASNNFLTVTQYFATQTLAETEIAYNFTIFDSSRGLTYYMYDTGISSDTVNNTQRIFILAVVDRYGNMIQYKYDDNYGKITQIIDTYGRVINFGNDDGVKTVSYTDENGTVQTIKYEKEILPATELVNGSPVEEKEVYRLSVTNAQGETTKYDSRDGETITYYRTVPGVPLTYKQASDGDDIRWRSHTNVERIIYPNGGETRYRYEWIYTSNITTKTAQSSYAVVESYDIVNGVEKNKKTYDYALSSSAVVKTETNSSSGLITVYNYDLDGMLTSSTASATGTMSGSYIKNTYTYAEDNQLNSHHIIKDGLSYRIGYTYSTNYPGMVTCMQINGKSKTEYTYHTIDGKATLIPDTTKVYGYNGSYYVLDYYIGTLLDSDNRAVEYTKTIKNNLVESQTQYDYDDYGRVISTTQWAGDTNGDSGLDTLDETVVTTTQYTENDYGAITVTNTIDGVSTTYNYGVTGLPYSMTDPKGYTTQIDYDNVGRATKYTYPNGATETADYNITSMFTNVKDKAGEYTWTYFNQSGLPTSKHFSNSQWTQFETNDYDTSDRLIYKKSTYDVDKYTAERYTYDVLDRVTSKQVYDNETLLYTENYTYSSYNTTKATTAEDGTAVATERETYDDYGRVTKKEVYTSDENMTTSYTYDYRDNILTETDPMGNVTTYTYDIFNNVTSVTYADGSAEYMYYDMLGRNTSYVDKNSVEYKNIYDELSRVTETQVNVDGTYVTLTRSYYDKNSNLTTKCTNINTQTNTGTMSFTYITYEYDSMNNLVGVSADDGSDGRATQYWYDTAGRLVKMATGIAGYYGDNALPDSAQITQYGYDIHGNMTSKTDQLGNVTTYTYDYAGNVTSETAGDTTVNKIYGPYGITSSYIDNGVSYDDYSYTYDNMGMMNSHTSWLGTETIVYDAFGRKISETSNGRTHLYSYDLNSRVTNYQMKNGTAVENDIDYTYDNMGRTTLIDVNDVTVNGISNFGAEIAYAYDTSGNLTSKVQGTNRTDITYNRYNQPVIYTNKVGEKTIESYRYTYNWEGNVLTEEAGVANTLTSYTYDFWGNLVKEQYWNGLNREITYTYDRSKNRTSKTVTGVENYTKTYTYDKKNQLKTETKTENGEITESITYTYNLRGNRGEKNITSGDKNTFVYYHWSSEGKLMSCDGPEVYSVYYYDALGRRIEKHANGVTVDYTWSGDKVMAELNSYGEVEHRYIYGVDGIAMDHAEDKTTYDLKALYYFKNAHGDVTKVVDNTGASTGAYIYEAFGGKITSPENDTNPFQYCGEYYDNESGLIYLRNRYYDPEIGAFISEDDYWNVENMIYGDRKNRDENVMEPYADAIMQSNNLYLYCMNNPVKYVDSNGQGVLLTCIIIGAVVGAISGGFAGAYVSKKTTGAVDAKSVTIGVIGGATIGGLLGFGLYSFGASISAKGAVSAATNLYKALEQGVNFTGTAITRMDNAARSVPVQVLIEAIKNGTASPDPQGTSATMYTTEMVKNGVTYTLEVLYDVGTNTIMHFKYFH